MGCSGRQLQVLGSHLVQYTSVSDERPVLEYMGGGGGLRFNPNIYFVLINPGMKKVMMSQHHC